VAVDGEREGSAIFIHRDTGVENEDVVAFAPHATALDDPFHLFPQALAADERLADAFHAGFLFGGIGVGSAGLMVGKFLSRSG